MAYAAVISLKYTINSLLNSCRISLISYTRQILESAHSEATSLQLVLERLNNGSSERLRGLDGKMRDCAHELEDVLEFHESDQLYSQHGDVEVRKAIASFAETVKKLGVEYLEELSKPVAAENDDVATVPSNIDFGVEMVGNSEKFNAVRVELLRRLMQIDLCFVLLRGEVGSGREIVAKTVFEDVGKGKEFECCAWVTIGTKYQIKEVLMQIVSQVDTNYVDYHDLLISREDDEVCNYLCKALEHRRYVIMLDDVGDLEVVEYLRSSLPNRRDGSIVFVTSSLKEMSQLSDCEASFELPAQYFEELAWAALRRMMFGNAPVPPELEEAGKKVIQNCRGLYISVAKAFLFLYKAERTVEQWSKIGADKENPIFRVQDEISEIGTITTEMQSYNWDLDDPIEYAIDQTMKMLTFSDSVVECVKMRLHPQRFFSKMQIISLWGMAGIGKSTLARKIFEDESILCHFDHHVWVTLGPKYQTKGVLVDILAQIYPSIDKIHMKGDEDLTRELCVQLSGKKCLIVLDDLWSKESLHHLKNVFPYIMGTTLVTTRLVEATKFGEADIEWKLELLDEEESWCLLCQKVFGEGSCPPTLEKAGRKIAENCEGLPLLIITVANQLLKVERSPEYWNSVASGKEKFVFKNAYDEISKALLPSYEILPQHLKTCFLYLGIFRNSYKIPVSKLTKLWVVERFLEPDFPQMIEDFAMECLSELVDRSLVMAHHSKVFDCQIKACRLHPVFWHLSNGEAVKNQFFHAMNTYADCSIESIMSQRRLCIRNSILLGMKDVQDSMAYATTTHSLLCVSPPHQYPVPISFNLRLLRVMDALTIRLYEFPVEVVKLVHLRHLGLTCNGNLPTSISNLWKLQHLIVSRYMNINSSQNSSPLPVEIWDMKELIHLQVMGGRLPNPKCGGGLPKLSTLLDVSAESCTRKVLRRIPNLKRLGIRIELVPNDKGNPFRRLNRISRLQRLQSLKCVVVNPQILSEVVAPPAPISMFPSSLKKLTLSGFGYPWEYMNIIGDLENLEVLKLKHYAFQGPYWVVDCYDKFAKLKSLLVDDTNLVHWEIKTIGFDDLKRLSLKHCYKLQKLPFYLSAEDFTNIEVVDCNPSVVTWADQMKLVCLTSEVEVNLSWMVPARKFAA